MPEGARDPQMGSATQVTLLGTMRATGTVAEGTKLQGQLCRCTSGHDSMEPEDSSSRTTALPGLDMISRAAKVHGASPNMEANQHAEK